MHSYLHMLKHIMARGTKKHPIRVESGATKNATIGLPNLHFSHDLSHGFPLLTTRRLNWKGLVGELRAFLEGAENSADFEKHGCNFWKPWAKGTGHLGPIYGAQWNAHGQLFHVLNSLLYAPADRRMVVSAWRPDEHQFMALPPCHVMWIVTPYDGKVNLSWFQRSCDFPIGVPYNIASYALLCHLLARWANLKPGRIDCIFADAHIYVNQFDGVEKQLGRDPRPLPTVETWFERVNDFLSWNVELTGYDPMPNIDFGEVEV